jgi:hypothetical protein
MTRTTFGILLVLGIAACGDAVTSDEADTEAEVNAIVPTVDPGGASGAGSGGAAGTGGATGTRPWKCYYKPGIPWSPLANPCGE